MAAPQSITSIVSQSKALEQVAAKLKNVMIFLAPKDTGNLKRQLNRANKPKNIIKVIGTATKTKASITLIAAPPGARYGKYWNKPYGEGNGTTATIKNRYPEHFDYKDRAKKDPSIQAEIKRLVKDISPKIAQSLAKQLVGK